MVSVFAERLMAAEVDVICNAGYGEVTPVWAITGIRVL
jgi:hypothetical protein